MFWRPLECDRLRAHYEARTKLGKNSNKYIALHMLCSWHYGYRAQVLLLMVQGPSAMRKAKQAKGGYRKQLVEVELSMSYSAPSWGEDLRKNLKRVCGIDLGG